MTFDPVGPAWLSIALGSVTAVLFVLAVIQTARVAGRVAGRPRGQRATPEGDARRQLVALGWRRHEARVLIRMARRLGLDLRQFVAEAPSP